MLPGVNRQVVLFMLYSALFHIGLMGIIDVILNFYFVSLGYGSETIGVLQALPRIGGLLTSIPIGLMANRLGAQRVLVYSTVGVVGSFVLLILLPSLFFLGMSRFLLGLFFGASQIVIPPYMMTLTDREHQTYLFSYHNVITMASVAAGSFVGGYMPRWIGNSLPDASDPTIYRVVVAIGGVVILASVLPFWGLSEKRIAPQMHLSSGIAWKKLSLLSVPLFFFGITGGLTFPFYNLFFRTTFDLTDETVGSILSLGWLGMGVITLANPWLEKHFGYVRALGLTMTTAAFAFFALSVSPTLLFAIPAFLLAISLRNTMQPLFQPLLLNRLDSEFHNAASSIGLVLWNIGWFMSTAIAGFLETAYGFDFIMQVVGVGLLITAGCIVWVFRQPQTQIAHSI